MGPTSKGRGTEGKGGGGRRGRGTCCKVLGGIDAPGGLRTSTCQSNIVYAYERNCQGTCRPGFVNIMIFSKISKISRFFRYISDSFDTFDIFKKCTCREGMTVK